MKDLGLSVRYLPSTEWAEALRSSALSGLIEPKLSACLEAYRHHSNFYAARLRGIESWHDIPPLEKTELINVPATTDEPMHETRSSGTTGTQAVIHNSAGERGFRQALAYRPFLFYPMVAEADNEIRQVIFVDGKGIDSADKQQWPFTFGGQTYLTWRVGIAAAPEQIYGLLKLIRPHVLRGLTSGIVRFAEALQRPLEALGVQVVSPSGEQLTTAWRNTLKDAFAAPVLDRYGATETGSMAWQCPYCDNYHVNSDEIVVEASDKGVLATPLFIDSQPLLRYRLDDRIELFGAAEGCRVNLPTLLILDARRDDWIIAGNGTKVAPLSFQFERIAGLKAWRLHQLETRELRLYFDDDKHNPNIEQQLAMHLQHIIPGCDYQLVDGTQACQQRGKFKRVMSDCTIV